MPVQRQRPQRLLAHGKPIPINQRDHRLDQILCSLLALSVLIAYWPAFHNGFINYDDPVYVTENPPVQAGLSWAGVVWAFTTHHAANWHPVTWLSHMADCQLFGLRPWAHHLVSICLHLINTLLVYFVFQKASGAPGRSFFAAALFGVHPLHVESVAWVAERKDVLSSLFWLLTLWFWLEWIDRQWERGFKAKIPYFLALLTFALGLMSKPMLVTVPFTLLLLDLWPLGRFPVSVPQAWGRAIKPLLWEKTPFFALALLFCVVTLVVQCLGGAVQPVVSVGFSARLGNAIVSYCRYLGKTAWPTDLAVFYPHPGEWPPATVFLAGGLLAALTALAVWQLRRRPYLFVGWCWFLVVLAPTIGIIQVGSHAMADRYTYMAGIGLSIILAWGIFELRTLWKMPPFDLIGGVTIILVTCVLLTRYQLGFWEDSETLFRHTLAVTNRNGVAHMNLGAALEAKGKIAGAQLHFYEAARLLPDSAEVRRNLGVSLDASNNLEDAIMELQNAVRLQPTLASAHAALGKSLGRRGRDDEAAVELRTAVQLDPADAATHHNLGIVLDRQGKTQDAMDCYREAIRLQPDLPESHLSLGADLYKLGSVDDAIGQFREVIRLDPSSAEGHNDLGSMLYLRGRLEEALAECREALLLKPDYAGARANLQLMTKPRESAAQP